MSRQDLRKKTALGPAQGLLSLILEVEVVRVVLGLWNEVGKKE